MQTVFRFIILYVFNMYTRNGITVGNDVVGINIIITKPLIVVFTRILLLYAYNSI